jgi:hypothetical protein
MSFASLSTTLCRCTNAFLISALDGEGWSPQSLYCRGNHFWYPLVRVGWVGGPVSRCGCGSKDNDSCPRRKSKSGPLHRTISSSTFASTSSCQSTPQQVTNPLSSSQDQFMCMGQGFFVSNFRRHYCSKQA